MKEITNPRIIDKPVCEGTDITDPVLVFNHHGHIHEQHEITINDIELDADRLLKDAVGILTNFGIGSGQEFLDEDEAEDCLPDSATMTVTEHVTSSEIQGGQKDFFHVHIVHFKTDLIDDISFAIVQRGDYGDGNPPTPTE